MHGSTLGEDLMMSCKGRHKQMRYFSNHGIVALQS